MRGHTRKVPLLQAAVGGVEGAAPGQKITSEVNRVVVLPGGPRAETSPSVWEDLLPDAPVKRAQSASDAGMLKVRYCFARAGSYFSYHLRLPGKPSDIPTRSARAG